MAGIAFTVSRRGASPILASRTAGGYTLVRHLGVFVASEAGTAVGLYARSIPASWLALRITDGR